MVVADKSPMPPETIPDLIARWNEIYDELSRRAADESVNCGSNEIDNVLVELRLIYSRILEFLNAIQRVQERINGNDLNAFVESLREDPENTRKVPIVTRDNLEALHLYQEFRRNNNIQALGACKNLLEQYEQKVLALIDERLKRLGEECSDSAVMI
jgi:hypothetical protein